MGKIRAIVRGTANDYETFVDLATRVCSLVEANEPGTLRYEGFVDEDTARFVWHEVYEDGSAFLQHNQNLAEAGVMQELGQLVEFDGMTVLGEVDDSSVREALEQFGAEVLQRHVGFVR